MSHQRDTVDLGPKRRGNIVPGDSILQAGDPLERRVPAGFEFSGDHSEHDVLAYMAFPAQHRTKLHGTNPLERLNKMEYPGLRARREGCLRGTG